MKKLFVLFLIFGMLPAKAFGQGYPAAPYPYDAASPAQSYAPPSYARRPAVRNQPQTPAQTSAQTSGRTISPFSIGADYTYGVADYYPHRFSVPAALSDGNDYNGDVKDFDRNLHSFSLNLGFRPLKNIGVEAFYRRALPKKKSGGAEGFSSYPEFERNEYEVSYTVYGLDVLGYFPINDYIEYIATIGVGKYDVEAKAKVVAYTDSTHTKLKSSDLSMEDSVWGYRMGAGVQLWMSRHLAFRLMGRWVKLGGDVLKSMTEVSAGVRYHF